MLIIDIFIYRTRLEQQVKQNSNSRVSNSAASPPNASPGSSGISVVSMSSQTDISLSALPSRKAVKVWIDLVCVVHGLLWTFFTVFLNLQSFDEHLMNSASPNPLEPIIDKKVWWVGCFRFRYRIIKYPFLISALRVRLVYRWSLRHQQYIRSTNNRKWRNRIQFKNNKWCNPRRSRCFESICVNMF